MKKSVSRLLRLYGLFLLLFALSALYIVLLTKEYRAYLADAGALTLQASNSLPSVGGSPEREDSAAPASPEEQAEAEAPSPSLTPMDKNCAVLGDADLLSLYSYDISSAECFISAGVSVSGFSGLTFDGGEIFDTQQTIKQILSYYSYDSCYLFFGLYESDWYYTDAFLERYEAFLSEITQAQPEARIYVHAIPYGEAIAAAGLSTGASDEEIDALNKKIALLAETAGAVFIAYQE